MSRYPREVRKARVKCIPCNAPTTETVDRAFVCVDCGRTIISGSTTTLVAGGE